VFTVVFDSSCVCFECLVVVVWFVWALGLRGWVWWGVNIKILVWVGVYGLT